ncbi:MAG: phosphoribosylanthranilate isomerase [Gaiellales bacterium]
MSVLVKICGLTRPEDVDAAVEAGADMLGFILEPSSARGIPLELALELASRAPKTSQTVAVFETAPVTGAGTHGVAGFDLVQSYDGSAWSGGTIHGVRGDPPSDLPNGVPVLLDLARGSTPDPASLHAHWARAAGVRAPVMLAGSLTPDNVGQAVRAARPWAVDTARGVESAPGVKDHALIRRFIANARAAA